MKRATTIILFIFGFVNLSVSQEANDQCSGAVSLTPDGDGCTVGTIVNENTNTNDPTTTPSCWYNANDDGIWYEFNTGSDTDFDINLTDNGATYTPMIAVYDGSGGCPGSGATPISGGCLDYSTNTSALSLSGLSTNTTYYILADMPSTIEGTFCIGVDVLPPTTGTGTSDPTTCGTVASNVSSVTCDDVGTGLFNNGTSVVTFSDGTASFPSPAPGCGSGSVGSWTTYTLDSDVTSMSFQYEGGTVGSGFSDMYVAFYQGTCGSLSLLDCQTMLQKIMGVTYVFNTYVTGLDPNLDLYVFTFSNGDKAYDLDFLGVGTSGAPSNGDCSTADAAAGEACNVGAEPATFNTPGSQGVACDGGNWGSNENTTFYSFTPSATTAILTIENITCNTGESGAAQFGVWTDCASIGTYGAEFLGCAVGTTPLSLTGLTLGETYYIAADGFAGDMCTWFFGGEGIILPIKLLELESKRGKGVVELNWISNYDEEATYVVERSNNGKDYESLEEVKGILSDNGIVNFNYTDAKPLYVDAHYRISKTERDGTVTYSNVEEVRSIIDFVMFPNPVKSQLNISFNNNSKAEIVEVEIFDVAGKLVKGQNIQVLSGANTIMANINTSDLNDGMYYVNVKINGVNSGIRQKLIKK